MGRLVPWLLAALAGAGSAGAAAQESAEAPAGPVLVVWHAAGEEVQEQLEALVARVHPAGGAEVRHLAPAELRDGLYVSAAMGGGPDLVWVDGAWIPELADQGVLAALEGMPGFRSVERALYPGALQAVRYGRNTYALPVLLTTQALVYNEDRFGAAGLAPPATFGELESALVRLRRPQDDPPAWGLAIPGPWAWYILPWVLSDGGSVTDEAVTGARGRLDGRATAETLAWLRDLLQRDLLGPSLTFGEPGAWEGFASGRYAAFQEGPWAAAAFPELSVAVAPLPAGRAGSVSLLAVDALAIPRGAARREAAWELARRLVLDEFQLLLAAAGRLPAATGPAGRPDAWPGPYWGAYLDQLRAAQPLPPHPRWGEAQEVLEEALWAIFLEEGDVQAVLAEAAARIDGLLQRW